MNLNIVELQVLLYLVLIFKRESPLKDDILIGFPFGNFCQRDCSSLIQKIETAIDNARS